MKRLMLFLQVLLDELGSLCGASTTHDWKTVMSRVEHEGLSFITITLPDFGKDFERSLDLGQVSDDLFHSFRKGPGGLPRFLGGFLRLVFDEKTGRLLLAPSVTAIHAIRQFTLMCGKINLQCTKDRRSAAFRQYMETEKDVTSYDTSLDSDSRESFGRISRMLWSVPLTSIDLRVYRNEVIPKHGPGSTAERTFANAKWRSFEWTERLERVFPSGTYLVGDWRDENSLSEVRILEPGAERPSRVVAVPKSLKTPRIIGIEPVCMQYMQQGLLATFRACLQDHRRSWELIGWASQMPNQHLAWRGSRNGTLATLDLSEASDRVSNQHVRILLQKHPWLAEGVDSCRTRKADVPGYGPIGLAKFASMGSALTFPLESMVFITIVFLGIERGLGRPLRESDIDQMAGTQVRTYGDDIIVPVRFVHSVIDSLESFGLKVNRRKSFWTGKFRESCGKEYYDGEDVSIVRLRSMFPLSQTDSSALLSTIETRNFLYKGGLWQSAAFIDNLLKDINVPMPRVTETSPVKGRFSFLGPDLDGKLDAESHRPLVRGVVVQAKPPESILDGWQALLKCLTLLELRSGETWNEAEDDWRTSTYSGLPTAVVDHLTRSGRPHSVNTKVRNGPST